MLLLIYIVDNFQKVFNLPGLPFATFILNTMKVVFLAVLGTILSSAMVAYAFARLEWPGRDFFFGLLVDRTVWI